MERNEQTDNTKNTIHIYDDIDNYNIIIMNYIIIVLNFAYPHH